MNYKKLVPSDSFIGQYLEYMSYVETAESYDFWCALWALGVGVGRGVYVDRPNTPVYCNWYIILAAESGTTRKSTAVDSISSIVGESHPLLTEKLGPERLKLLLHESTRKGEDAQANLSFSELVNILGREGYMAGMPGTLTDLYGCPALRTSPGTIASKGELVFKNVYINFLSASTPAWLVTAINPSVIEGGFTSRVIFVVDDTRKRSIAWPGARRDDASKSIRQNLQSTVQEAKAIGPVQISPGGLKKFKRWYNGRATHTDPFLSSFEAREDDHILCVAACLSINDGILELQSKHISSAIRIIDNIKRGANSLFGGDFSQRARITGAIARVREILIEAGTDGIKHFDLQRRVVRRVDAKELHLLISILHECGMIQRFKVGRGEMYRATKAIERFGVTSEVLAKLNLN